MPVKGSPQRTHDLRKPSASLSHGSSRRRTARSAAGPIFVIDAEQAVVAANRYALRQYPLGVLAGTPRLLSLSKSDVWIVPIILTSPGHGAVGELGVVAVNARIGAVVGATPKEEVIAAGKRLREENRDELEAAFRRARTV